MNAQRESVEQIRALLNRIYKSGSVRETIDALPDKEIPAFVRTLRKGLHLATNVFDGAYESEIKELLRLADAQERTDSRFCSMVVRGMRSTRT